MDKYSIAISTFFGKDTPDVRLALFKKSMNSLFSTSFKGTAFVVDDGSVKKDHIEWLKSSINDNRLFIYEKKENGGVSKCKNTGIRLILENGDDVGFLADDDMIYKDGWDVAYFESMKSSGVHHFNFYIDDLKHCTVKRHNNVDILKTPHTNGCFMTFTKQVFEKVGNFAVMPTKYGHEHGNFTIRCLRQKFLPFPCDIINSRSYLEYPEEAWDSRTVIRDENEIAKNYKVAVTRVQERIVDEE